MDKAYNHQTSEAEIYARWEKSGAFQPIANPKAKPYSIVLPPPNANANLHIGHAMYVVEDILIRFHRMRGFATVWLAGADHAGFETQYVYEKHLAKQDKSRFDYEREELYQNIFAFVMDNRGKMENQLRRLGFSLDWSRNVFTLDPEIIKIVYRTFKRLHDEGLVYRGERLVNYCTKCGTSFSDLEVLHVEKNDPLYYMKYGPFTLATVRPETKFGDTAIAVNPKDKRYKQWIGKEVEVEGLIGTFKVIVIADEAVDPEFGTGVVKVTPAHDFNDFDMGKRHNLEVKQVIGRDGRLNELTGPYQGLKVKAARQKVVEDLEVKGFIEKIDDKYVHTVGTCYKCGTVLEPMLMPQWFIKVKPLADKAIEFGKKGKIKVFPRHKQKHFYQKLEQFIDWNISRQIVWGIRIPAWKCHDCSEWTVTSGATPTQCYKCNSTSIEQDTDTFDTWFSSAQWPFATLEVTGKKHSSNDLERFFPLSVMETGYDILTAWVCRMAMLGIFATGKEPFKHVFLHGLVRDAKGQKMSKSKGNVINPLDLVDKYGADALRFALVFGTASGSDVPFSEDKARGMRNFANKLWNIGRFILLNLESEQFKGKDIPFLEKTDVLTQIEDQNLVKQLNELIFTISKNIEKYAFNDATQQLYDFAWHTLADKYLETIKARLQSGDITALSVLRHVYLNVLKLLHPFMPFVTEAIWKELPRKNTDLLISSTWPKA